MSLESKAARELTEKLNQIEPGTPRYLALETAKKFKTSWVELGGKLYEIRKDKAYEGWGFESFEDYCQQEIHIRPNTASKLTASFAYLKNEFPGALKRDGVHKPIPDLEAVEMMRRYHEKSQLPPAEYDRLKSLAFEDEAPVAQLRREARPHLPPPATPSKNEALKKLVLAANRLADALAQASGIPRAIIERALALVDDLRGLQG